MQVMRPEPGADIAALALQVKGITASLRSRVQHLFAVYSSSINRSMERVGIRAGSKVGSPRFWVLLLGLGVPTLTGAVSIWLVTSALPLLPDRVAIHWGFSGPDGFASPSSYLWMVGIFVWLLPSLMAASMLPSLRRGKYTTMARFMTAMAVWLSVFLAVVLVGSLLPQRGLADAADAQGVGLVILVGFGASILVAGLVYLVLPTPLASDDLKGSSVAPLPLAKGEVAAWSSRARQPLWVTVILVLVIIGLVIASFFVVPWYFIGLAAILSLLLASFASFRVSVGAQGLVVSGALGRPRKRMPLQQIVEASLVQVDGFQEWGGWGWRIRPGAIGVITRNGPAIQVRRRSGEDFVVTAEDSAEGVAVLSALIARESAAEGEPLANQG